MSYWISQPTYEIGLRLAVGCTRNGILSIILAHGVRITLYGILCALLTTRFPSTQSYGFATTHLLTFATVTVLVLTVALLVTVVPAWTATRIDPVIALRTE